MSEFRITAESFGGNCPNNWEEIADYLNNIIDSTPDIIDELGDLTDDGRQFLEKLWEDYCMGNLPNAPEAEF